MMEQDWVLSVSDLNEYVRRSLAADPMLQGLRLRGEISNFKRHSSGHWYFTLKDAQSRINCVMFRQYNMGVSLRPADGMAVIVSGSVSLYVQGGAYQLYVQAMRPDGLGSLYAQFEERKARLAREGLLDAGKKRPLPLVPRGIAIVTSPTGAVLHDIRTVSARRNPAIPLTLLPVRVQGDGAAEEIAAAIRQAGKLPGIDVIITGRGGGSLEDLWAFNEERVAQAVFDCEIPIISAVGHETDTTIIDYVADLRAPTPSAAAELAVYDFLRTGQELQAAKDTMNRQILRRISMQRTELRVLASQLKSSSPMGKIREKRARVLQLEDHLQEAMRRTLDVKRHQLAIYIERLKGLSPLDKLNQGYSYVADGRGRTVTGIQKVQIGDPIQVYVKDGRIDASVTAVNPMNLDR